MTYTYYDNNQLERVTHDPFTNEVSQVRYQYDEAGNLEYLTYPGNKVVHYEYDELNRLHMVTPWVGQPIIYTHDPASRLERGDLPNGVAATYSYDDASRLTDLINQKSDASIIASYHFTLDGVGNRIEITRTELFAPMFSPGTTPYTYNGNHHLLLSAAQEAISYDQMGNLVSRTGSTPVTYDYDHEQRLTQVSAPSAQYAYDGAGRRLEATRSGELTLYILDASGNVLAEADRTGITRYYIYGLGLVAMITETDDLYTYHFNAVGSTMAITDALEKIINKYSYNSFGAVGTEVETIKQPFKFVGQHGVMTEPNGLYFMRARYYDPTLGRFLQPDPLGFAGGDVNLYVYASNNPILLIDPWGLCSKASNKHFYAAGVWNKNTSFSAQLGQGVSITTKNVAHLGLVWVPPTSCGM